MPRYDEYAVMKAGKPIGSVIYESKQRSKLISAFQVDVAQPYKGALLGAFDICAAKLRLQQWSEDMTLKHIRSWKVVRGVRSDEVEYR